MFAEYYEPLPDVDAYLERIGMERPKQLTKEYLDELVMAHQCSVPFENLDIYDLHKPISIKPKDIFEKVVVRKRGGYCFELNGLFVLLLQALGYDAYSCPCRVLKEETPTPNPVRHRGNIIRLDGKYLFCDVGFGGPMPPASVVLEDKTRQIVQGETFWFERTNEFWWILKRLTKGKLEVGMGGELPPDEVREVPVLMVSQAQWENVDFTFANEYCSTGPDAPFARERIVNVKREDGHISLRGNSLTIVKDGARERREVTEEEAWDFIRNELGLIVE
ncbi:MAG TPA: arylamine N-acetyltransferase [Clostridiales bacterium]|jgi:N-hydroxyarylamine O-acetyltransferase|nr:arylamine N-acetyltransferase [Clostridiales bacterium]